MEEAARRAFYRVNAGELAKLCGVASYEELVVALEETTPGGQPFLVSGESPAQREARRRTAAARDAAALRRWFRNRERAPAAPRTNVAVVSTASRPGPLDTPSRPKALLRVGDATLLTHCLRGIAAAGVRHVVLVLGGPTSAAVTRHVKEQKWAAYFATLRLVALGDEYARGHAASLLAAARVLLGPTQVPRPFLLVGVDHVYDHRLLRRLVDFDLEDGGAGVCVVETREDIISRLKLATHNTAVKCDLAHHADPAQDEYDAADDDDRFFAAHIADASGDSSDDDDGDSSSPRRRPRTRRRRRRPDSEEDSRGWIREIGRDLERWQAVEAGAFVLTPRVFDALTKLARSAPYFTLCEALGQFCGRDQVSSLRAMHSRGLPWIAVETEQQHVDATLARSPLFSFISRDEPSSRGPARGVAVPVELCDGHDRVGVFNTVSDDDDDHDKTTLCRLGHDRDDDQRERAALVVEKATDDDDGALGHRAVSLRRKVSSGSLAALLDTYDRAHRDDDDDDDDASDVDLLETTPSLPRSKKKKLAEEPRGQPLDMYLAVSEAKAALAVFVEPEPEPALKKKPTDEEEDEEVGLSGFSDGGSSGEDLTPRPDEPRRAVAYPSVKRRRVLFAPPTDIERVRLRLFTDGQHNAALAVRVERRVPTAGYLVLAVGCVACASTSAFQRELPAGVSGPLRSVWRQTVTALMLSLVELGRCGTALVSLRATVSRLFSSSESSSSSSKRGARRHKSSRRQQLQMTTATPLTTTKKKNAATFFGTAYEPRSSSLARPPTAFSRRRVSYRTSRRLRLEARERAVRRVLAALLSVEVDADLAAVVLRVVAGFAAQNMALCVALLFLSTPVALTMVNATPLWLVAHAVCCCGGGHEDGAVVVGTLLGFAGAVALCAAELADKEEAQTSHRNPLVGVLVGLGGGLGGAVYVTAAKRAKAVPPTRLLLLANVGALALSILVFFAENPDARPSLLDPTSGLAGWTRRPNLWDSLGLSAVVDGVGVLGVLSALRYVDPLVVAVSLQLEPVVASLVDAAVGVGTLSSLTPATALGTAVVLVGCTVVVANSANTHDIDASSALEKVASSSNSSGRRGSGPRGDNGGGGGAFAAEAPTASTSKKKKNPLSSSSSSSDDNGSGGGTNNGSAGAAYVPVYAVAHQYGATASYSTSSSSSSRRTTKKRRAVVHLDDDHDDDDDDDDDDNDRSSPIKV